MFDDFYKRNKAIAAALELAAEGGAKAVTFPASPCAAISSLADLRREFTCKTDILRAFQAEIDAEVLAKSKPVDAGAKARATALFDTVMTRFEAMKPYKPALRRIAAVSALPARRSGAAHLRLARLAILDAGRRRRQARRSRRRAPRRRACRDLRQGVPRLARRRYAVARPHHGGARPAGSTTARHAVRHGSGLRRCLPLRLRLPAAGLEARRASPEGVRPAPGSQPARSSSVGEVVLVFGAGEILRSFAGELGVDRVARHRRVRVVGHVELGSRARRRIGIRRGAAPGAALALDAALAAANPSPISEPGCSSSWISSVMSSANAGACERHGHRRGNA